MSGFTVNGEQTCNAPGTVNSSPVNSSPLTATNQDHCNSSMLPPTSKEDVHLVTLTTIDVIPIPCDSSSLQVAELCVSSSMNCLESSCVTLDASKPTAESVVSPPLAPTFTEALSTRRVYSTCPKKRTRLAFEVNSGVDRCVCSKTNESFTENATNIGLLLNKFNSGSDQGMRRMWQRSSRQNRQHLFQAASKQLRRYLIKWLPSPVDNAEFLLSGLHLLQLEQPFRVSPTTATWTTTSPPEATTTTATATAAVAAAAASRSALPCHIKCQQFCCLYVLCCES